MTPPPVEISRFPQAAWTSTYRAKIAAIEEVDEVAAIKGTANGQNKTNKNKRKPAQQQHIAQTEISATIPGQSAETAPTCGYNQVNVSQRSWQPNNPPQGAPQAASQRFSLEDASQPTNIQGGPNTINESGQFFGACYRCQLFGHRAADFPLMECFRCTRRDTDHQTAQIVAKALPNARSVVLEERCSRTARTVHRLGPCWETAMRGSPGSDALRSISIRDPVVLDKTAQSTMSLQRGSAVLGGGGSGQRPLEAQVFTQPEEKNPRIATADMTCRPSLSTKAVITSQQASFAAADVTRRCRQPEIGKLGDFKLIASADVIRRPGNKKKKVEVEKKPLPNANVTRWPKGTKIEEGKLDIGAGNSSSSESDSYAFYPWVRESLRKSKPSNALPVQPNISSDLEEEIEKDIKKCKKRGFNVETDALKLRESAPDQDAPFLQECIESILQRVNERGKSENIVARDNDLEEPGPSCEESYLLYQARNRALDRRSRPHRGHGSPSGR